MEIVSFEIAKKLKEKGFREPCTHFYRNGTFRPQEMFCGLRSNTHHKWSFNSMEVKLKDTHERIQVNIVDAPTISQVLKWLREEKKIHICIDIWKKDINDTSFKWGYDIVNLITARVVGCDTNCANTYELAALAGIEYVIDNLI